MHGRQQQWMDSQLIGRALQHSHSTNMITIEYRPGLGLFTDRDLLNCYQNSLWTSDGISQKLLDIITDECIDITKLPLKLGLDE